MTDKHVPKSDDVPTSTESSLGSNTSPRQESQSDEDSLDARTIVTGRPTRGPDSNEEKESRTVVDRPGRSSRQIDPAAAKPKSNVVRDPLETPTEILDDPDGQSEGETDERTGVYRPGQSSSHARKLGRASASEGAHTDAMDDPPSGWLVIVAGPGKGNACVLRHGRNPIGRNPTERVPLDYGDEMISRSNHAVVTYDPKGQKFYIQQGQGTNLIYINGSPVLDVQPLEALTHIQIGRTTLRFVPLCGDSFDWSETE